MKISFAITVHNEGKYLSNLLESLIKNASELMVSTDYEIVILDDYSTDLETLRVLRMAKDAGIEIHQRALNNNFSVQKNHLNSLCRGEYIFQIDADEFISPEFIENFYAIINTNLDVEAFYIPRVNTVLGLTEEHVKKWRWSVVKMEEFKTVSYYDRGTPEHQFLQNNDLIINEFSTDAGDFRIEHYLPVIQWPDFQMRIYKNKPEIKWEKPVHETLTGFTTYSIFPVDVSCAIWHHKSIERQEKQNEFYDTLMK